MMVNRRSIWFIGIFGMLFFKSVLPAAVAVAHSKVAAPGQLTALVSQLPRKDTALYNPHWEALQGLIKVKKDMTSKDFASMIKQFEEYHKQDYDIIIDECVKTQKSILLLKQLDKAALVDITRSSDEVYACITVATTKNKMHSTIQRLAKSYFVLWAKYGYVSLVQKALNAGVDINMKIKGRTALYEAARKGQAEVVELLLKEGADPFRKTDDNETAFQIAAPNVEDMLECAMADSCIAKDKSAKQAISITVDKKSEKKLNQEKAANEQARHEWRLKQIKKREKARVEQDAQRVAQEAARLAAQKAAKEQEHRQQEQAAALNKEKQLLEKQLDLNQHEQAEYAALKGLLNKVSWLKQKAAPHEQHRLAHEAEAQRIAQEKKEQESKRKQDLTKARAPQLREQEEREAKKRAEYLAQSTTALMSAAKEQPMPPQPAATRPVIVGQLEQLPPTEAPAGNLRAPIPQLTVSKPQLAEEQQSSPMMPAAASSTPTTSPDASQHSSGSSSPDSDSSLASSRSSRTVSPFQMSCNSAKTQARDHRQRQPAHMQAQAFNRIRTRSKHFQQAQPPAHIMPAARSRLHAKMVAASPGLNAKAAVYVPSAAALAATTAQSAVAAVQGAANRMPPVNLASSQADLVAPSRTAQAAELAPSAALVAAKWPALPYLASSQPGMVVPMDGGQGAGQPAAQPTVDVDHEQDLVGSELLETLNNLT